MVELRALLIPDVIEFVELDAEGIFDIVGRGKLDAVEFCELAGSKYKR